MAFSSAQKKEILQKHQRTENDTGSPEAQISLLTHSIQHLTAHMKIHPKDTHSRGGLSKMVAARRKLLDYLKRQNMDSYKKLIEALGIRR
jgi:small subunit ribosomal protein S15